MFPSRHARVMIPDELVVWEAEGTEINAYALTQGVMHGAGEGFVAAVG